MNYPPYPAYKPTGLPPLPDVPEHWCVRRLRTVAAYRVSNVDKVPSDGELPVRLCNYTDVYHNERIHPGMTLMHTTATADEVQSFGLRVGDVVITKDSEDWRDIAVPGLVTEAAPDLVCGYHLAILRPSPRDLAGPFLLRALQSCAVNQQFQVAATGVTRFGLPRDAVGDACIPLPTKREQCAIAAFLDRETAKLDALVERKQALIGLLKEKRTGLISHTVTRGLPPAAARAAGIEPHPKLKPSGVEWIGEVPDRWEVEQLRRVVVRFIDYRGRTPEKTDDGVPLITAGAVKDGAIDHALAPEYMAEEDYGEWMRRGVPEVGDVVITTEAPLAEVAQVQDARVAFAQRIILLKVNRHRVLPEFLRYYYLSGPGRTELLSRASGSTAAGIRADRLRMSLVLVPPLREQDAIVRYLDRETSRLAAPIAPIEAAIARLQEYRAALITAAVTGKIDVRGADAASSCRIPDPDKV